MILDKTCLLVCGSRRIGGWDTFYNTYTNHKHFEFIYESLDSVIKRIISRENLNHKSDIMIVSGAAKGPDEIAMLYAIDKHIPFVSFPAQWKLHGKKAGYMRNIEMLNHAEYVVAFYDGESKGTKHTITNAKKQKKLLKIIDIN